MSRSPPRPRWTLHPFRPSDFPAALALWQRTEGMGLGAADTREKVAAYLRRNPGLSCIARLDGQLIGAVLCGHDGRRGFLYHLAVDVAHRGSGLGRALVEHCLAKLQAAGLTRCHIVVYAHNESGKAFWRRLGWKERTELCLMSWDLG